MNCFHCRTAEADCVPDPTALQTPLGTVRFFASVGGNRINPNEPTHTYRVSNDGWLVSWQHPYLDLELLICRPHFAPPLDMPVTDCWGALWRIRANAATGPLILAATWDTNYRWQTAGPNGGQYLHASIWSDEYTDVSIGTQDDEMLSLRTRKGNDLPPEWESYFLSFHAQASYGDNTFWNHPIHQQRQSTGIACPLPALKAGQAVQIPFAVAWATIDDLSGTATSIAVEATPTQILAGANCT